YTNPFIIVREGDILPITLLMVAISLDKPRLTSGLFILVYFANDPSVLYTGYVGLFASALPNKVSMGGRSFLVLLAVRLRSIVNLFSQNFCEALNLPV